MRDRRRRRPRSSSRRLSSPGSTTPRWRSHSATAGRHSDRFATIWARRGSMHVSAMPDRSASTPCRADRRMRRGTGAYAGRPSRPPGPAAGTDSLDADPPFARGRRRGWPVRQPRLSPGNHDRASRWPPLAAAARREATPRRAATSGPTITNPQHQVGHGDRPRRLHRLQRLRGRLPGGEQHPGRRPRARCASSREMHWIRIDRYFAGDAGATRDVVAPADAVPALRERAVRAGLPGRRDRRTRRRASTTWSTTAASARGTARTTARTRCAASTSSTTPHEAAPSSQNLRAQPGRHRPHRAA